MSLEFDKCWIWHPDFTESQANTAGLFVHFRREIDIGSEYPPNSLKIHITADTRYKLYVNRQFVAHGPIKGDRNLWFYDEVDIGPFLTSGKNLIGVHVLRFFHSTTYAPSFARLPTGGLRISPVGGNAFWNKQLASSSFWETAIDWSTALRVDDPEDHFLHVYEKTLPRCEPLEWVPAKVLEYKVSTGNSTPWNLSPRLIPTFQSQSERISKIHNVWSNLSLDAWMRTLCLTGDTGGSHMGLLLLAGTRHLLELEAPHHMTAFIRIRFRRPATGGSVLKVKYAESYEDEPVETPWVRRKGDRCDYSKALFGPQDQYHFQGPLTAQGSGYLASEDVEEVFMPFHFRTFRFIGLDITVDPLSDLILESFEIETTNYPLEFHAQFKADVESEQLWTASIRTLQNCMHDCYEDCPFYEQLQYAMDTRSSALFTYCVSGDDRLSRQAMLQIHNSFDAQVGLTASRAPTHRAQFIPAFSLYWICMVFDHLTYYNDRAFVSQFLPVVDAILWYFHSRIDQQYGLTKSELRPGIWNYVDWTQQWKPHGIPPSIERTGISTFTNQLYAHTLSTAAQLASALGRSSVSVEYHDRANRVIQALLDHCFDGEFFSDTITSASDPSVDYSQHCQVWGVLSGAVTGEKAQQLLRNSLWRSSNGNFVQESVSMSFYTLRALSLAGGGLYDEQFHRFWDPWRRQLEQNVTTWVEDAVSQRSDCHAWGSVPIHEFMVEVAGIRPAQPGWAAVEFRPRFALFKELNATVPLGMENGRIKGLAHVSWLKTPSGIVKVSFRLEGEGTSSIPVHIFLPGKEMIVNTGTDGVQLVIRQ